MKRLFWRVTALVVLIALTAATAGCWDAREMDAISIVAGISVDTADQPGVYNFTLQVGKAEKGRDSGSNAPAYTMMSASAETLLTALKQLRMESSRDLFLHSVQTLVISENAARQGIQPIADMFVRHHETRLQMWVFIAEGNAKDTLMTDTQLEAIPSVAMSRLIEHIAKISVHYGTVLIDLLSDFHDKDVAATVPIIARQKGAQGELLSLTGIAVFSGDKMVGKLDPYESRGYAMILGDMHNEIITVPMEMGTAVMEISSLSSKLDATMKDGQLFIDIDVDAEFVIGELQGFDNIKMGDLIPQLKQASLETIINKASAAIQKTQQLKADIFDFGCILHGKDAQAWHTVEDIWQECYANAIVNITASGEIVATGKVGDSLDMKGAE